MLREYKKLTQQQLFPGDDAKRSQVTNAEKGRNKFQGPFLRELAKAFGAPLDVFEAYLNGDLSLERFINGTNIGIAGMGDEYHARKAREFEAKRMAEPPRRSGAVALDPLEVVKTLNELDGIPYERAVRAAQDVRLEAGDSFGLYVAARLKLRAEAGERLPGELVMAGPDVDRVRKPKKVARR